MTTEMTLAEIKDLLDQLADAGVLFLTLSGGEVLMRMDFFEILKHARRLPTGIAPWPQPATSAQNESCAWGCALRLTWLGAELPPQLEASVRSDRVVSRLAAQIKSRLASREHREIGILQRAAFRMRMRGGLLAGAAYLLRLSLSPTEEDWPPGKEGNRPAVLDAISRPLRLARKHGRRSKD